jgi:hypothetical protein
MIWSISTSVLLLLQESIDLAATTPVPWSAVDPVSLAVVGGVGVVLLFFGGRLFRPCLVLAASVAGAMIGFQLASATRDNTLPAWTTSLDIPPLAWVIGMPILAGILAAIFSRLVLAILIGAIGVVAVMLIAVALIGLGKDGGTPASNNDASAVVWHSDQQDQPADPSDGNDQGLLEGIRAAAVEELGGSIIDVATQQGLEQVEESRRRLGEITDSLFGELRAWWVDRTSHVAPAMLDLVMAIAVVVGIAGFVIALIRPVFVASIGTAVVGGWMLMACGALLWSRVSSAGDLPSPFLMLLGWGFATGVGLLVQASTGPAKKTTKAPPSEA